MNKSIHSAIALGFAALTLCACSALDTYTFGDGTRAVLSVKTLYCKALPAEIREAALGRMQVFNSGYPDHSVCDIRGFIIDIIKPIGTTP